MKTKKTFPPPLPFPPDAEEYGKQYTIFGPIIGYRNPQSQQPLGSRAEGNNQVVDTCVNKDGKIEYERISRGDGSWEERVNFPQGDRLTIVGDTQGKITETSISAAKTGISLMPETKVLYTPPAHQASVPAPDASSVKKSGMEK